MSLFVTSDNLFVISLIAPACNAGDVVSIPGLGRSPGEGKGYPLQSPGLENSMYSPWGCKESDTTHRFSLSLSGCVYLVHCYDLTLHCCCLVAKSCPNL